MDSFSDDITLFKRISLGEEEAFRHLFRRHVTPLSLLIKKIIGTEMVVEDIIQEIFLKVWIKRDQLNAINHPRAWLTKITYHHCFNYLRQQQTRERVENYLSQETGNATTTDPLLFQSILLVYQKAIDQLPTKAKKIYQLSRNSDLSLSSIALQLGLSERSVKNSISRSLLFIREYITKNGFELLPLILIYFK